MTTTFRGPRADSSLRPSCSSRAVNSEGAALTGGAVCDAAAPRSGEYVRSMSNAPGSPVSSTTGRPTPRERRLANAAIVTLRVDVAPGNIIVPHRRGVPSATVSGTPPPPIGGGGGGGVGTPGGGVIGAHSGPDGLSRGLGARSRRAVTSG